MSQFVLTPIAQEDMEAVWQYIARDSIRYADLVEEAILCTCDFAAEMPQLGHSREEINEPEVLFLSVTRYKRYSIAYRVGTAPLEIVRVLHGSRDVSKIFRLSR